MARRRMLFDDEPSVITSIDPTKLSFPIGIKSGPMFLAPYPQYIKVNRTGTKPLKVWFSRIGKAKDLNTIRGNGDIIIGPVAPPYTPKVHVTVTKLNEIEVRCDTNLAPNPPIDEIWRVAIDDGKDSPFFEFYVHQDGTAPTENYIEVRSDMGTIKKDINYTIGSFQIGSRLPKYNVANRVLSIGSPKYEFDYTTSILVDESLSREVLYFKKGSNFNAPSNAYLSKMNTSKSYIEVWVDGAYSIRRNWNEVADGGTIVISFSELPSTIYSDSSVVVSVYAPPKEIL